MRVIVEAAGAVAASSGAVADVLLGPPGDPASGHIIDEALVGLPGARVVGGPRRFDVVRGDEHLLYVGSHVDPGSGVRTLSIQGHW